MVISWRWDPRPQAARATSPPTTPPGLQTGEALTQRHGEEDFTLPCGSGTSAEMKGREFPGWSSLSRWKVTQRRQRAGTKASALSSDLSPTSASWSFPPPPAQPHFAPMNFLNFKTTAAYLCVHGVAVWFYRRVWCLFRWLFMGVSRCKASELLMQPNNPNGAFLIRASETNQGQRVASVPFIRTCSIQAILTLYSNKSHH